VTSSWFFLSILNYDAGQPHIKHNFVDDFLVTRSLKIADKGEECVNDRTSFLNLRGIGAGSEYCPASR